MLDGEVVDGPGGGTAARRRRPALERARQLARRDRASASTRSASRLADAACDVRGAGSSTILRPRRQPRPTRRSSAAASTWSSAATCTSRTGPTAVVGENGEAGYTYTTARPAERRTPSRSAASRAARRRHAADLPRRPPGRDSSRWCCRPTARSRSRSYYAAARSASDGTRARACGDAQEAPAVAASDPRACTPTARPRTAGELVDDDRREDHVRADLRQPVGQRRRRRSRPRSRRRRGWAAAPPAPAWSAPG